MSAPRSRSRLHHHHNQETHPIHTIYRVHRIHPLEMGSSILSRRQWCLCLLIIVSSHSARAQGSGPSDTFGRNSWGKPKGGLTFFSFFSWRGAGPGGSLHTFAFHYFVRRFFYVVYMLLTKKMCC